MQRSAHTAARSQRPFQGALLALAALCALVAALLVPTADGSAARALAVDPSPARVAEDLPGLVSDWSWHGSLVDVAALLEAGCDPDSSEAREDGRRAARLERDDRAIVRLIDGADERTVPLVRLIAAPSRAPPCA